MAAVTNNLELVMGGRGSVSSFNSLKRVAATMPAESIHSLALRLAVGEPKKIQQFEADSLNAYIGHLAEEYRGLIQSGQIVVERHKLHITGLTFPGQDPRVQEARDHLKAFQPT